ncbi:DUF2868 domain-containing protein [Puniceicoccaceae bacterium K14]|nr:DUF2868 domain-containing protein [Puniceicoccaceae bacterium K14]
MTKKSTDNKSHLRTWSFGRILELETQLFDDQAVDEATLVERDRKIAEKIGKQGESPSPNRSLLSWLKIIREEKVQSLTFEELALQKAPRKAALTLGIVYFFIGLTLSWNLLRYNGEQAINVSAFIGVIILIQALAAATSLILLLLGLLKPKVTDLSIGSEFAKFFLTSLTPIIARVAAFSLSAEKREDLLAKVGRFRSRLWIYKDPLRWKFFQLAQSLGMAFNLGAILALATAVTFSDRAFGWQTSLDITPEAVHSCITTLSLPWSWALPETKGFPDLLQIQGSQIVLKDGILSLNTADLTSWWPFLILSTIVYGFFPRLILNGLAHLNLKKCLRSIDIENAETKRVLRRLNAHQFAFTTDNSVSAPKSNPATSENPNAYRNSPPTSCQAWIASTLETQFSSKKIKEILFQELGAVETNELRDELVDSREQLKQSLSDNQSSVCFVLEAWLPPLEETKQLVRNAREVLAPKTSIHIALIGHKHPSLHPNFEQWKRIAHQLSDPYLTVSLHEV